MGPCEHGFTGRCRRCSERGEQESQLRGSEVEKDVGIGEQHRARLRARLAGNIAGGYAAGAVGPEMGNGWRELAPPGEIADLGLQAADIILERCGL